jgi:hypothetical protein
MRVGVCGEWSVCIALVDETRLVASESCEDQSSRIAESFNSMLGDDDGSLNERDQRACSLTQRCHPSIKCLLYTRAALLNW